MPPEVKLQHGGGSDSAGAGGRGARRCSLELAVDSSSSSRPWDPCAPVLTLTRLELADVKSILT